MPATRDTVLSSVTARVPTSHGPRIANAAVRPDAVRMMIEDGSVSTLTAFVAVADAVRGRLLRGMATPDAERPIFSQGRAARRSPGRPSPGRRSRKRGRAVGIVDRRDGGPDSLTTTPMRLVFLATPGQGCGGSGGLKQPLSTRKRGQGNGARTDPVPRPRPITTRPHRPEPKPTPPRPPEPVAKPVEPPPPEL